ncbi:hypothetical protein F542_9120 [Bibersteinia trehalosi USDA-ARS-USMARC-188]|uniref:Uncharacterized protein n=2 Tax=Bibersteinia trehalosi TaxID=47735 RepID=A0A4V7I9C7_BIBTR|nr:hypothetical protein WQG_12920 [Bibersteinia trehalosi USDA-ARS-USMARC-192]AHG81630.1 hypothetical protein F542_9120 [Bibersteinia trehalosi USDA-ARS-USMARC-188]AHG83910.1 hypothetical protein F543_10460 [Bibersteinia trehalosi USDA-ARS-USMARC-189]
MRNFSQAFCMKSDLDQIARILLLGMCVQKLTDTKIRLILIKKENV